ncbi:hypothetical protein P0Y35_08385 [Kiritimatiellaeota bacterium B1221]|nr:hypothetical protein [Kiritimatiellaeota bacterium B1221]
MSKGKSHTRYESPFARVFTSNSKKRDYWQPPILPAISREESHYLESDYYEEEAFGASVVNRIAGILLGLFLMIGGVSTAIHPKELSREVRGQKVYFSAEFDVVSGLFCLTLGAFILWLSLRHLRKRRQRASDPMV